MADGKIVINLDVNDKLVRQKVKELAKTTEQYASDMQEAIQDGLKGDDLEKSLKKKKDEMYESLMLQENATDEARKKMNTLGTRLQTGDYTAHEAKGLYRDYKVASADYDKELATLTQMQDAYFNYEKILDEYINKREEQKRVDEEAQKQQEAISNSDGGSENVVKGVKKIISFVKKWGLALIGIRSTYALIHKGFSAFMSANEEWSRQMKGIWNALGEFMSPAIEWLLNLLIRAVSWVNAFVKALTGVDVVARANAKSLAKQNKQLNSAPFDEQNKLGGSGSEASILKLVELTAEEQDTVNAMAEVFSFLWDIVSWLADKIVALGEIIAYTLGIVFLAPITAVQAIILSVKLAFEALWKFMTGELEWSEVGTYIIDGLKRGLGNIWELLKECWVKFIDKLKDFFGIHSPSKLFEGLGGYLIEGLKNGLSNIWEKVKEIFSNLWKNVKDKAKEGFQSVVDVAKEKLNSIIEFVEKVINSVIKGLNKLIAKVTSNSLVDGALSLLGVNASSARLSEISLPRLAVGGVTMRPTQAIIGEAGREAVLPLDRNTEWADIIADKINGGQNQTIIIQMDGKTISKEIRNANRRYDLLTNGGV